MIGCRPGGQPIGGPEIESLTTCTNFLYFFTAQKKENETMSLARLERKNKQRKSRKTVKRNSVKPGKTTKEFWHVDSHFMDLLNELDRIASLKGRTCFSEALLSSHPFFFC